MSEASSPPRLNTSVRFSSLGSGSRGNAALVESGSTLVLVDCGFSLKELTARLGVRGRSLSDIDAVVVTHEHTDHVGGLGSLLRRTRIPAYMTSGTFRNLKDSKIPDVRFVRSDVSEMIGDFEVLPFTVPHDAREPAQYVFANQNRRIGFLTDCGSVTPHILDSLQRLDALVLECNHDDFMLRDGSYPAFLKKRIAGKLGHLSNVQSADLVKRLDTSCIRHFVAAHLSEENNLPDIVRTELSRALEYEPEQITVASQECGFDWLEV